MNNGQLTISLFDLVVIGILLDAQNFVIVLSLALFELELGVADLLCDVWFLRIGFLNGLEFLDSGFPVAGFTHGFRLGLPGLGIGWVETKGTLAVCDSLLVLLEL